MDTLVALGSTAAFVYSTYALFAMTGAQVRGDADAVMDYMMDFYFESAAMILTLITVGKMLEARSKGKTTDALKSLMKLAPEDRNRRPERQGRDRRPIEQVQSGDTFVVRPGESIPVDGVVLSGTSAVNEAALTGESIPADKAAGDTVSAATRQPVGLSDAAAPPAWDEDTTLSQIIQMVSDAAATKAPIAKIADKVSGVFVPAVISHRTCDHDRVAPHRKALRLQPCARDFRARHQLPVRTWSCDPGCHHGRKRSWRKERHSLQNGGKPRGNRPYPDRRP